MTLYVDSLREWGWKYGPGCHLIGDSFAELQTFAVAVLGLRASWIQLNDTPHYDLTRTKRVLAVAKGAVQLDSRQFNSRALILKESMRNECCKSIGKHDDFCSILIEQKRQDKQDYDIGCRQYIRLNLAPKQGQPPVCCMLCNEIWYIPNKAEFTKHKVSYIDILGELKYSTIANPAAKLKLFCDVHFKKCIKPMMKQQKKSAF